MRKSVARVSSASGRAQRRELTLRVTEGEDAVIESAEIAEVVDAAFFGLWASGYHTGERVALRSYRVRVERADEGVRVKVDYDGDEGGARSPTRESHRLRTGIDVTLGQWTRLTGRTQPRANARRYEASGRGNELSMLIRVDPVP